MTVAELAAALRAEQEGGAFACTITHRDGRVETDRNGFATALVLRELRRVPRSHALDPVCTAALAFLERCADPRLPGAFGFWPLDARPVWARLVPPDCDDTAVLCLELLRAGRRSLRDAQATVYDVLMTALCTDLPSAGPSWRRSLTFATWLDPERRQRLNPLDCGVNANVLALMAACDLTNLPGYEESIAMIEAAVDGAVRAAPEHRRLQLAALTPYYPDPRVFASVLEHAVTCGVEALRPVLRRLHSLLEPAAAEADHVLCGNAYGGPTWRCRAFELVRAAPAGDAHSMSTASLRAASSIVTR